jgi:hypothetical protein
MPAAIYESLGAPLETRTPLSEIICLLLAPKTLRDIFLGVSRWAKPHLCLCFVALLLPIIP